MFHNVSSGGPDRAEPNGVRMDRVRDAERPWDRANPVQADGSDTESMDWFTINGLVHEPSVSSCAALITKMQQEPPIRVGEPRSTQAINMIVGNDPMQLQPLQLAAQARVARFPLGLTELRHRGQRLKVLLQGAAERDLMEPFVDLRGGCRQLGPVRGHDLDHEHI